MFMSDCIWPLQVVRIDLDVVKLGSINLSV